MPPRSISLAVRRANGKNGLAKASPFFSLVRRKGFEPLTFWFVAKHSIQLSYRRRSLLKTAILYYHGRSEKSSTKLNNLSLFLSYSRLGIICGRKAIIESQKKRKNRMSRRAFFHCVLQRTYAFACSLFYPRPAHIRHVRLPTTVGICERYVRACHTPVAAVRSRRVEREKQGG